MKKETYLTIADPCHESWNEMTAAEQGRFCGSCCKTVVDFSEMSDKQILQVISKAAGKTCGRFTSEQLQRPLQNDTPVISKPYKFFLSAFIPTFIIANTALSQQTPLIQNRAKQATEIIKGETAVITVQDKEATAPQALRDTTAIKAPINTNIEEKSIVMGMVAPFVKPCIVDTPLVVKSINQNEEAAIAANGLNSKPLIMGGIEAYSKITFADTVNTIVRKTFNQQLFKVFSNPAKAGSDLRLEFKQAGNYTIQLLDGSGRLYFSKTIAVHNNKETVAVKLPSNAVAGNYFIKAIDNEQKKDYADKIIIS